MDDTLDALIVALRDPLGDAVAAEAALSGYIRTEKATGWEEGVTASQDGDATVNPYGDAAACTCGFGGFHEPGNTRCERTREHADLLDTLITHPTADDSKE